jgi:hypothetical protein
VRQRSAIATTLQQGTIPSISCSLIADSVALALLVVLETPTDYALWAQT